MKKYLFGLAVAFALVGASSANAYTFNVNLTLGSAGADVVALQDMLIAGGHLVMPAGVSKGYFGALTQTAVAKWQAANGIAPAAGYFGPISRAKASSAVVVTPSNPSTPTVTGGEEGDITVTKNSGSSEDLAEGDEVEVYSIDIEAEDSDVSIERVDFTFDVTSGSDDLWDAIDSAKLLADGDEVAEVSGLDDEDNWSEVDSDTWKLRFTNVDAVVEEDDEVEFTLELVMQNSVDESDYNNATDFSVRLPSEGVRAMDGAGIDVYGASSALSAVSLDVSEPDESEVTLTESDDSPDTSTIVVDDENETDDVVVLVYEIESEDDSISIDNLNVDAVSASSSVNALIDSLIIEIDGQEFDGEINSTSASSTYFTFEIDGDVEVDEDDMIEVVVKATFNEQDGNYSATGESIAFNVDGDDTDVDAESGSTGDDLADSQITGDVQGDTLTLALLGLEVDVTDITEEVTPSEAANGPYVTITYNVTITNNSSDTVYVPLSASVNGTTGGFRFASSSLAAGVTSAATTTISVDQLTDRTEASSSVRLQKGQDAEFEVSVTFNPNVDTNYRLELDTVRFDETAGQTDLTYTAPETSEFKSAVKFVSGN